jgi:MYXO-CTERM domain-containing protein
MSAVFGTALLLAVSPVLADTAPPADQPTQPVTDVPVQAAAQVIDVASGAKLGRIDGEDRDKNPGTEQTTVVLSKGHLVLVTMEAVQEPNQGPVQCSCSSYEMRPDGPPRLVTAMKRLTAYPNGNRTCNHPKAAADENGNIVWMFGSDTNSNRPNTYAGILNEKCEQLAAPQMVSIPRNANDGAPDITYLGGGKFAAAYYSDGNNTAAAPPFTCSAPGVCTALEGGDYSVAMGLEVVPGALLPTLARPWIKEVLEVGTQKRPEIAMVAPDRALLCATKGPNRPADDIECALFDTANGTTVWKAVVAKGDRDKKIYYNQPSLTRISENKFALQVVESNAMGKGTNIKGTNLSHILLLERNGDTVTVGNELVGAGAHQTHGALCAGSYGVNGAPTVAVFTASPSGIGRAHMQMVGFDQTSKLFSVDKKADLWPTAYYGDSGHLSNWYGRNPMRQGRDFLRCIGDVPNPGYHVDKGYLPDVKTFFVGTVSGRKPGEAKNGLTLSLVPGQVDKKVSPSNPVPAGEAPALDPNADTTAAAKPAADDSGCGCTTVGGTTAGGTSALLGMLALGLVVSLRRRKD